MIPWWIQSILLVILFVVVLAIMAERIILNNYNPYIPAKKWKIHRQKKKGSEEQ